MKYTRPPTDSLHHFVYVCTRRVGLDSFMPLRAHYMPPHAKKSATSIS